MTSLDSTTSPSTRLLSPSFDYSNEYLEQTEHIVHHPQSSSCYSSQSNDDRTKSSHHEQNRPDHSTPQDQTLSFVQMCRKSISTMDSTTLCEPSHSASVQLKPSFKLRVTVNKKLIVPFPVKLYHLISNANADCFQWTNHGTSFTIFATNGEKQVSSTLRQAMLPKLSTFIRTLNLYGWRQPPNSNKLERTYFHPSFHKCAALCDIARSISKKTPSARRVPPPLLEQEVKPMLKPVVSPSPRTAMIVPSTSTADNNGSSSSNSTTKRNVAISPLATYHGAPARQCQALFSPIVTNTMNHFAYQDFREEDDDHHEKHNISSNDPFLFESLSFIDNPRKENHFDDGDVPITPLSFGHQIDPYQDLFM